MYNRILYVSGPLRVPNGEYGLFTPYQLHRNIRIAEFWAVVGWRAGWMAVCPHLNTLYMDGCGVSSEQFIAGDIALIQRLAPQRDAILMGPGWHNSEGSVVEYEAALEHGLYVVDVELFQGRADWVGQYLNHLRESMAEATEYFESLMATA